MDFLEFLKSEAGSFSANPIVFDGVYFKRQNDTFPLFEVDNGTIREYSGAFTKYSLSSVNTWGGNAEYAITLYGSTTDFTGYSIKMNGSRVELYHTGTRDYGDSYGEDETTKSSTSSTASSSSSSSSSSGSIAWPSNPFGQWGMCIVYSIPLMLVCVFFPWWVYLIFGGIFAFWFIMILCYYAFKGRMSEDDDSLKSVKWYEGLSTGKARAVDILTSILVLSPIISLIIVAIVLIAHPISIFRGTNIDGLIAMYVIVGAFSVALCVFLFLAGAKKKRGIIARKGTLLGICGVIGCVAMIALFATGASIVPQEWHLTNTKDFNIFLNAPDAKYCTFYLDNDIDLNNSNVAVWEEMDFHGTFDGQGFTLKNYAGNCALFQKNSGIIKNLNISGVKLTIDTQGCSGIIAGANSGTIKDCIIENATVQIYGRVNAQLDFGCFAGKNEQGGNITGCSLKESYIKADWKYYSNCGGIVGLNEGKVSKCSYVNTQQNTDYKFSIMYVEYQFDKWSGTEICTDVGGIVGYNRDGKETECIFEGTIGKM